jgi:hypothetical protein
MNPPTCLHCGQPMPLKREGNAKPTVSQIEREKQECAYYLNVCWPAICADEPTPDSTNNEQTPP